MRKKTAREARESRLANGWVVEGEVSPNTAGAEAPVVAEGADAAADADADAAAGANRSAEDDEAQSNQMSSAALVLLGLMGGLYLIYTWVWFSWSNFYSVANSAVAEGFGTLGAVLQQVTFWAAPLAPALWFFAVLWLNRGKSPRGAAIWLVVGAVLLVPLPMFEFGGVS